MIIKELIQELSKFDQEMEVTYSTLDDTGQMPFYRYEEIVELCVNPCEDRGRDVLVLY